MKRWGFYVQTYGLPYVTLTWDVVGDDVVGAIEAE